jgi:hypothetical protein
LKKNHSIDVVADNKVTNLDFFLSLPSIGTIGSKLVIQNCLYQATGGDDCDCTCGGPPEMQFSKYVAKDCDCTCTAPQCAATLLKLHPKNESL